MKQIFAFMSLKEQYVEIGDSISWTLLQFVERWYLNYNSTARGRRRENCDSKLYAIEDNNKFIGLYKWSSDQHLICGQADLKIIYTWINVTWLIWIVLTMSFSVNLCIAILNKYCCLLWKSNKFYERVFVCLLREKCLY